MNRRQLIMLSGTAAVAGQAFAQTRQTTGLSPSGTSQRASYKALLKLSRSKSSYKIPKTDAKRAKYIRSLSGALSLSAGQQQQVDEIFANALNARATLRASLKIARHNLHNAVKRMDTALIEPLSAMVGNLKAQLLAAGASANAALYRLLTPEQQAKLIQFQS
jgi:Spy/CpxP family protein refolding chaperone